MIWQDGPVTVYVGDALTVLRELPAKSVHCVVTSPPYWGLRDYGIPGQLGLEATPEEYIARMVEVFREVRRVLRPDGTLWLNMGDSYASKPASANGYQDGRANREERTSGGVPPGLKAKDLVGIPWRLAFALQADGWWLRSDIIWAKPNPMPESVTDRPTKSHEYLFLLTKQGRYFYDAEAVREPATYGFSPTVRGDFAASIGGQHGSHRVVPGNGEGGRNLRSVWTIATQPYPEAHFATFPEELARRCIAAGTSERGCCPECGASWARVVESDPLAGEAVIQDTVRPAARERGVSPTSALRTNGRTWRERHAAGWQPTCAHHGEPLPCTVLDPFAGSGTTLAVARRMGRRGVGIELQPSYLPLIQRRVSEAALPLLELIGS